MQFTWFPAGIPRRKRLFDLLLVVPGLIIFLPVMGLVALAILIFEGRPVTFRQERPGYHARIINVVKFRTMHDLRDSAWRFASG